MLGIFSRCWNLHLLHQQFRMTFPYFSAGKQYRMGNNNLKYPLGLMSLVSFGWRWELSSVLLMWEKCRISWLEEYVFGRRQTYISPSLLMRNDQASTHVVCDHVMILLPALHWVSQKPTLRQVPICRQIGGYSWVTPVKSEEGRMEQEGKADLHWCRSWGFSQFYTKI